MSKQFRDLNHNGTMEPYEDPGLPVEERVSDLLGRMTLAEKAGQLFHSMITPAPDGSVTEKPSSWADEDTATERVTRKMISHFNILQVPSVREIALWHNRLQEVAAGTRLGIPVTLSSDPRHSSKAIPIASWRARRWRRSKRRCRCGAWRKRRTRSRWRYSSSRPGRSGCTPPRFASRSIPALS